MFFSRITLESRLGQEYEPIIYAALRSSKVMIAIGTKPEYFESPWVRNEWNRYLGMIEEEPGEKTLIPVYRDMDPYDMPEEFAHLQGLNAANIGFLQDLVHGVEKLVKSGGSAPAAAAASTATVESLLQRAELFLEAGQFDNASQYCERVLDMAPKDYRPYLYQTLCHFKLRNTQELASSAKLVHMNANFQNALRFAPPSKQAELTQIDPLFSKQKIEEMVTYFHESSDMGKLYLNYPMVESFYHMKSIPDPDYMGYTATLQELSAKKYKERVRNENRNHSFSKFAVTRAECNTVIRQNIEKGFALLTDDNKNVEVLPDSLQILRTEMRLLEETKAISVLCTCIYYVPEYNPNLIAENVAGQ